MPKTLYLVDLTSGKRARNPPGHASTEDEEQGNPGSSAPFSHRRGIGNVLAGPVAVRRTFVELPPSLG